MSIAARVQHHPARAALLPALLAALEPLPTEVITDPRPSDDRSPWRTYLKCLADPPGCSHLLIIQDDAVPCRNFAAALERIAEAVPTVPVVLFVSREAKITERRMRETAKKGRLHYAEVCWQDFLPVVALMWPVDAARRFHEWALANPRATGHPNPRSDDAMGGKWMSRKRERIVATVPSLVEHPDLTPSLIRSRHSPRHASMWIGDRDPLEIDWTRI